MTTVLREQLQAVVTAWRDAGTYEVERLERYLATHGTTIDGVRVGCDCRWCRDTRRALKTLAGDAAGRLTP